MITRRDSKCFFVGVISTILIIVAMDNLTDEHRAGKYIHDVLVGAIITIVAIILSYVWDKIVKKTKS